AAEMKRTFDQWRAILVKCGVQPAVAVRWGRAFADEVKENSFSKGDAELDDFLGQVLHESLHLTKMVENMRYTTAARLVEVFPSHFKTLRAAQPFVLQPEMLATLVYGGRYGNTHPGDGWKYRARGPIGLTFYDNYLAVGDMIGQDLVVNPELMEQPHFAL